MNQLHINDRKQMASLLHLPVERFDTLLESANRAHDFIKKMGPFYGKEEINEPTFRITAEPVHMPIGSRKLLTRLGDDLLFLGKSLKHLPGRYKEMLGVGLDYRIPLSWRIHSIIGANGKVSINEVEGIDSVSALMMIEQLAYGLQSMEETTIAKIVRALQKIFIPEEAASLRLAIVRNDLEHNPFTPNARRFLEILYELSHGTMTGELFDIDALRSKQNVPEWHMFNAVLNEAYCSPEELYALGVKQDQLLAAGNYNALVNKGVFALVHERALRNFWSNSLGIERYERLRDLLIPSQFITAPEELEKARAEGKVCKVTWADGNMIIVNRAKGVAIPVGELDESTDERWNLLRAYLDKGYTIISQDFVEPARIHAFLRKKSTSLEPVEWYNRVCVKYVVDGNPNVETMPSVSLTATEVTLGPDVIPAGRKCAFTAGAFF